MRRKKKVSPKVHRIIVGVLVALGGYLTGIVTKENPELGNVVKEVVEVIGSTFTNPIDSIK